MTEITESMLYQLEERLASCLNEHADMCDIQQLDDGTWYAEVHYEGEDSDGHKATIKFSFGWHGQYGIVEDFILLGFYGKRETLFNPNIVIG